MKHIYFTMRDDKSLLNEEDIAFIAYAVCRKEFNKNNLKAEARDFAKLFDNLRIKEIENPSIKYLLKNDCFTSAVKLYEDKYNYDYDTAVKNVTKMYDRIRRGKEKSSELQTMRISEILNRVENVGYVMIHKDNGTMSAGIHELDDEDLNQSFKTFKISIYMRLVCLEFTV